MMGMGNPNFSDSNTFTITPWDNNPTVVLGATFIDRYYATNTTGYTTSASYEDHEEARKARIAYWAATRKCDLPWWRSIGSKRCVKLTIVPRAPIIYASASVGRGRGGRFGGIKTALRRLRDLRRM
jgi:hypothetical protein